MTQQILFIHGAGEGAYDADRLLADDLQEKLGAQYKVAYLKMPDETNAPYDTWASLIEQTLIKHNEPTIIVGHSIGASHLAKMLTQSVVIRSAKAIFLLETPFWGGEGWLYDGYETLVIPKEAAGHVKNTPLFFYHSHTDEVVPFEHLALYEVLFPYATTRVIEDGDHQLNNDLSVVAKEIASLS